MQLIKGIPRVLGFTYNEKLAELKMEYCGESIQKFMQTPEFLLMNTF